MKKLILSTLMALTAAIAFAGEEKEAVKSDGLNGGLWYFGFQTTYEPQADLNSRLATLGYTGFSELGMGFTYGGAAIINNVLIGGWGAVDFGSSWSVNSNAGKTLVKDSGTRGGLELGYVLVNTPGFIFAPAFNLIGGGSDYYFKTNMSFDQFINNPVSFASDFYQGHWSAGGSLLGLIRFNPDSMMGILLKVTYLYSLTDGYGPVNFTSGTPVLGKHTILGSVSFAFGGYDNGKRRFDGDKKSGKVIRDEMKEEIKEKIASKIAEKVADHITDEMKQEILKAIETNQSTNK